MCLRACVWASGFCGGCPCVCLFVRVRVAAKERAPLLLGGNKQHHTYTYIGDRLPHSPTPCSGTDVFHLHWLQLTHQRKPPRTLDPNYTPTPTAEGMQACRQAQAAPLSSARLFWSTPTHSYPKLRSEQTHPPSRIPESLPQP
jgi:hypothetical protein